MRVYFVRHGQTDANIHYDQYPWNTDCPINAVGTMQARQTAAFLQQELQGVPALIMASPLRRAQQTASLLAGVIGATVQTVHDLRELDVGDWRERDISTVYAYFMQLAPDERYVFRPPAGETWAECGQRVASLLADVSAEVCVIVSHSAPIQTAIGTLLDAPYSEWATYEIRNASVSLLESTETGWGAAYIGRIFDESAKQGLF